MFTHSDLTKAHEALEEAYEDRKEAIGRVDNDKLYKMQDAIHNAFNKFLKIETYLIEQDRSIDAPSTKAKRIYISRRRTLFTKNTSNANADKHFSMLDKKGTSRPISAARG